MCVIISISNKFVEEKKMENKFNGHFVAEIIDRVEKYEEILYGYDPNYYFSIRISTVEAKKDDAQVKSFTKEELTALNPVFKELNIRKINSNEDPNYYLVDNEDWEKYTREGIATELEKLNIFSEVRVEKVDPLFIHVFGAFPDPNNDEGETTTTVYVTPKKYWTEEECVWDQHASKKIYDILKKYGFQESQESVFLGDMSPDEIKEKLKAHPEFEYDKKFEKIAK